MSHSAPPEVTDLLETGWQLAKQQPWGYVAIAMVGRSGMTNNIAWIEGAGELSLMPQAIEAVTILKTKLEEEENGTKFPPQDESLDHSYVRYNIANGPLGYDFLCWMVEAEMIRRRHGAPAPLKVGFWLGKNPERTMRDERRTTFLNNVFRPALALIEAVEDERAIYGHHEPMFVPRQIIAAARNGEEVPKFKAPERAKTDAVTITLREAEHHPHRNSNLDDWIKFGFYLQKRGERVIYVRDTARSHDEIRMPDGFVGETYPPASKNLHTRMALYEGAKANLVVANGPSILCVHSDRPWLEFCSLEHEDDGVNTFEFWSKHMGLTPHKDQYPWSAPNQRIIWKADTYENIVEAWEEHIAPTL